jgi:predicted component of type VI protein secretion system
MYKLMSKVPVLRISTVRGCGGVDLHTRSLPALLSFVATSDYGRGLSFLYLSCVS